MTSTSGIKAFERFKCTKKKKEEASNMNEPDDIKRYRTEGSLEVLEHNINLPKLQPPVPHHQEVYVLRKLRKFSRWQRRYCVMSAGVMKIYAKSTDPYKGRLPLQTIDLSSSAVVVHPKERKLVINCKASTHHVKAKKKALFDRLLGNLHRHRSYALTITEARQTMYKSYQNLSSLFATIVSKKDFATAENLYDQMGQIIKDLEYIYQSTINLTNAFEANVEKVAVASEPVNKRRFSLQSRFRSRINALRQRIRRMSDGGTIEIKSEETNMRACGQDGPYTAETNNSPLKDYLTVQKNFLDIAKLFVDKAAECIANIQRSQQRQKEAMKMDFLALTEPTRTRLEQDLNATQTVTMLSFSQDSKSDTATNFGVRLVDKEDLTSEDDSGDSDEEKQVPIQPRGRRELQSPSSSSAKSLPKQPEATAAAKLLRKGRPIALQASPKKADWELFHMDGVAVSKRQVLPTPMDAITISLWTVLKQCFGKNLTRISLPVFIFEPLNMLQVLCEELEYSNLLDKAAEEDDRFMRMAYIALFAASRYKSTQYRTGRKPFNPVIGETRNEEYTWNKATSCLRNILSDNRYFEHYGEMNFSCKSMHSLPVTCKLQLKPDYYKREGQGSVSVRGEVWGQVLNEVGKAALEITGNWTTGFFVNGVCAWRPNALPEKYEKYYGFTEFGLTLNDICPGMEGYLPPSDTRFRPDQRMVEQGRLDEAEDKKQAIEEYQRNRRKRLARQQKCHMTKWFE